MCLKWPQLCCPCVCYHWGNTLILLCTVPRFIQRMTVYSLAERGEAYWGWSGREGGVSPSKLVFPSIRHVNPEISKSKQSRKKPFTIQTRLNPWWNRALCTPLDKLIWSIPYLHSHKVLWEGARGEGVRSSWQPRVETFLLSWQPETGAAFKWISQARTSSDLTFRTSVVVVAQIWILWEPDEVL